MNFKDINTKVLVFALLTLIVIVGPAVFLWGPTMFWLMGLIIPMVGGYIGIKQWIARRAGNHLVEALTREADGTRHRLEIEALKSSMKAAISQLKARDRGLHYQGSAALYTLPWYILIGPAAAGKSTLLRQSGLHFPMDSAQDIQVRGFGGTRNCDWWFSDNAIFLDTAGRYTTEVHDRPEWLAFLKTVKQFRSRRPVNGLIVALTLSDLLTSEAQLIQHAKLIRERLQEISGTLGFVVPVTLVLTKSDQLKGFTDFFKSTDTEIKNQTLGIHWFEEELTDIEATLTNKLNLVYAQLVLDRVKRLKQATTVLEKTNIVDFPENFQSMTPYLIRFVRLLVEKNPYQETPLVTGLYWTSALQDHRQWLIAPDVEGKQFQLIETLQQSEMSHEPYFVNALFQQVIIPEQHLLRRNPIAERQYRIKQSALYLAGFAGLGITAVGLWQGYQHNQQLLQTSVQKLAGLTKAMQFQRINHNSSQIAAQAMVHEHLVVLQNESKRILSQLNLGLYHGDKQVPVMSDALATTLQATFVRPLMEDLQKQLAIQHAGWANLSSEQQAMYYEQYHGILSDYIALQPSDQIDVDKMSVRLASRWEALIREQYQPYSSVSFSSKTLQQLVEFYLLHQQQHPDHFFHDRLDERLIAMAQNDLILPQDPQLLYQQAIAGLHTEHVDIYQILNSQLWEVTHPLSKLYTTEAWFKIVQPKLLEKVQQLAEGDQVIGHRGYPEFDQEALFAELKILYEADYQQQWLDFLSGLQLKAFDTLPQATTALYALSDVRGAFPALFRWVAANRYNSTALSEIDNFTTMTAEPSDLLKQYLMMLSRLQNDLLPLTKGSDTTQLALVYAQKLLNQNGMDTELYKASVVIDTLVMGVQNPALQQALSHVLLAPIETTWNSLLHQAANGLQVLWQQEVMDVFDQKLASRYPFSKVEDEVALADLTAFFRPHTGTLWSFVDTHLRPFVTSTRTGIVPKRWLGKQLPISEELLIALQKAERLTQGLFRKEGQEIGFDYYVYPVASPGLQEIALAINHDTYRYRNEPQEWRRFSWPGDLSTLSAKISAVSQQGKQAKLQTQGIWSFFKLLEKSEFSSANQGRYIGKWKLKTESGETVSCSFMFKGDRKDNVFEQLFLTPLQLPHHIQAEVG